MPRGYYGRRRTFRSRKGYRYYRNPWRRGARTRKRSLGNSGQFRNTYGTRQHMSIRRVRTPGELMPDKLVMPVKFNMFEQDLWLSGGGAAVDVLLGGNDLTDPGRGNSALQAMGLDQLGLFYKNYVVYGSSIKVNITLSGSNLEFGYVLVVVPSLLSTGFPGSTNSDISAVINQPYARHISIEKHNRSATLTHSMSSKKLFGESFLNFNDYGGDMPDASVPDGGVSPPSLWYWHCFVYQTRGPTMAAGFQLAGTIELVQKCAFSQKRFIANSVV